MAITTFQFETRPIVDASAIVTGPEVRFSVLTSRLFRMEYDPGGLFEDRPSQVFWFRQQPVPSFEKSVIPGSVQIETEYLKLDYQVTPNGFTPNTLSIELKKMGTTWHYGDQALEGNLQGTARTLDRADGPIRLESGLLSRHGWSVVDDSHTLVFNPTGWLEPRSARPALDLYFFGYGHDYTGCLQEYTRIAGGVPMPPRWMLGNWWSRYWPYSQDELRSLMEAFRQHEIPLSVCIVDMDWHITQTGNASSGWTGYTWNRTLFPDPTGFLDWLHQQGLHTALNLHPAEGVFPHEEQYTKMAAFMGIDPASQEPVPFDISNPHFMEGYFDILHHPMEEQGVDFWWIDWQQGTSSRLTNLDPLWFLNHLHFLDAGRNHNRRPIIFSRWGGLGNQRYPIGFSGDTFASWKSLAFQPYFTATAANVNYGWWSHDIGGHQHDYNDRELYTRWVQFGVFSPILRLHSTANAYQERRPWGSDAQVFEATRKAMRLRHSLIPYIYSMAWRNTTQSLPLTTPMYYLWPEEEPAYHCPDQYYFGSELIAAPYVSPANPETRLSRCSAWLPDGNWFDFFTGEYHQGGKWHALFGSLEDIPIFARAGAIIPLGPDVGWGGIDNPTELTLLLFPGKDNHFALYEDDGNSQAYLDGHYCTTHITQSWSNERLSLAIEAANGDTSSVPQSRTYTLMWRGIGLPEQVEVMVDGTRTRPETSYDADTETFSISAIHMKPSKRLVVNLVTSPGASLLSKRDRKVENLRRILRAFNCDSETKRQIDTRFKELLADPSQLEQFARQLTEAQMAVLLQAMR